MKEREAFVKIYELADKGQEIIKQHNDYNGKIYGLGYLQEIKDTIYNSTQALAPQEPQEKTFTVEEVREIIEEFENNTKEKVFLQTQKDKTIIELLEDLAENTTDKFVIDKCKNIQHFVLTDEL